MEKLLNSDEFRGIKIPAVRVEAYLKTIKENMVDKLTPEQFLVAGIRFLITQGIIYVCKEHLRDFLKENTDNNLIEVQAATASLYAILKKLPTYNNLFFVQLFIKNIKDHPLMNDPKMWNLIYPFLPSKKIVSKNTEFIIPEKKKEEIKEGIILTDTQGAQKSHPKDEKLIIP